MRLRIKLGLKFRKKGEMEEKGEKEDVVFVEDLLFRKCPYLVLRFVDYRSFFWVQ